MKKYLRGLSWIVLLGGLILILLFGPEDHKHVEGITFEYLEDPSGDLSIEEIAERSDFMQHEGEKFSFGKSSSAWWIRFKIADSAFKNEDKMYLAVYNPTVGSVDLFTPIIQPEKLEYNHRVSGWMYGNERTDEHFFYPVFKMKSDLNSEKYNYMRLHSPYTQNYTFQFLDAKAYQELNMAEFLVFGLLTGIILAVIVHSWVIYIELKDKSYLVYILYMMIMFFYQVNLFGFYSVFNPTFYKEIMSHTMTLGTFSLLFSVLFFKCFFTIKNRYYNFILYGLLAMYVLALWMTTFLNSVFVNSYMHIFSVISSAIILYIAISIYRQGTREARFYIWGWGAMVAGILISLLRHLGLFSNNSLTLNIIFISVAINAIFLSTALVDRVKSLANEKERTQLLYKEAEVTAKINEIAFLQAQVKPHFLYNALNVIASISVIDGEKARELIIDIAAYLRHTFDFKNLSQHVSLEEELEYVEAYFRIEQARYGDRIELVKHLEDFDNAKIPQMVIQPLVENALKHGVFKLKKKGIIEINGWHEGDEYILEVKDNGIGMTAEKVEAIMNLEAGDSDGIGLINIQKRMANYYHNKIEIVSRINEGTSVLLRIPKESGGEFKN